jgi:hypothetical protein
MRLRLQRPEVYTYSPAQMGINEKYVKRPRKQGAGVLSQGLVPLFLLYRNSHIDTPPRRKRNANCFSVRLSFHQTQLPTDYAGQEIRRTGRSMNASTGFVMFSSSTSRGIDLSQLRVSERRSRVRNVTRQVRDGAQKAKVLVLPVLVHRCQLAGFFASFS